MNGEEDWKFRLLDGQTGPKPTTENARVLLAEHPAWAGKLGYCERRKGPVILNQIGPLWPVGPWQDVHSVRFQAWAERCLEGHDKPNRHGVTLPKKIVDAAVEDIAMRNRFDPVEIYLRGLEWDGIDRLNTFLINFAGAPDEPYVHEVTRKWMISAVARVMQPGCQADHVLVLESGQGTGKTSLFRALGGEWALELYGDLTTRDAAVECHGAWIVELADLAAIRRAKDIEAVKAFITRRTDKFVNKYEKFVTAWPRRFVMAATLNPDGVGWVSDSTGGRRFWPIPVKQIAVDAVAQCRDQLWAEAVHWFTAGESWWLANGEIATVVATRQGERIDTDTWTATVERFITEVPYFDTNGHQSWGRRAEPLSHLTVAQVLEKAFNMPISRHDKSTQMRVAKALTQLGFEKKRNTIIDGKKDTWWIANGLYHVNHENEPGLF